MRTPVRHLLAAGGVTAALLFSVGCSSDDSSSDDSTTTTAAKTTTTAAEGTVIDQPGPVSLKVGETATIVLEANPTTGYQWEPAVEPDAAVVRIVSDNYEAPDSDAMGAAGSQRIVIEGVAAGTTELELKYIRPWEPDATPAETATYQVTVA